MRICYRGMFPMVILMMIVMNIKIGCEADDVFSVSGIDEESVSAKTLIQIGRRLNKPMLTLIGMAMKNLHRCSEWTRWTKCSVKISNRFGVRNRNRQCNARENGKTSEVETDLGLCEAGTSTNKKGCPNTYTLTSNGFCIKLQATRKNHDDAEAECNEDGGHLININSDLKYADVKVVLSGSYAKDINIGGRRKSSTSPWEYTYGTNSGYFKWFRGYPTSDSSKACLALEKLKWWNLSCSTKYPFLCEIP